MSSDATHRASGYVYGARAICDDIINDYMARGVVIIALGKREYIEAHLIAKTYKMYRGYKKKLTCVEYFYVHW